jgi:ribosomal protein S27E
MKTRATCAYCGVELPWAINEESDEQENPDLNVAELLGSSDLTRQMASGATYPVACGACGEALPQEEKPETCPGCHAMVRDPYSGKLVYAEETANNTSTVRIVFLIAMLLACACAAVYIFKLLSRVTPP